MRVLAATLLLSATAFFGTAAPALADGHIDIGGQNTDNDETVIEGTSPGGSQGGRNNGGSGGGTQPVGNTDYTPQPWTQERMVPACQTNSPSESDDALCMGALAACRAEGEINMRVYTRLMSAEGVPTEPWQYQGTRCVGGDTETGVQQPQVTTEDVVEQARSLAPPSQIGVEPEGESYVNVPNNFYADSEAQTVTVSVFGIAIPVSYAPTDFTWDFGDGATGSGPGEQGAKVGAPGAVEHAYATGGTYEATVTTTYSVSFTLPGGNQVTVPGEVSATSDPVPLQVGEIQAVVSDVR